MKRGNYSEMLHTAVSLLIVLICHKTWCQLFCSLSCFEGQSVRFVCWFIGYQAQKMLEIIGRYWERDSLGCGAANPSWGVTKVDWWSGDQAGELRALGSVTKSITNIINIIISGGILALASTRFSLQTAPVLRVNNVISIHGWSEMKTVLQEIASTREC